MKTAYSCIFNVSVLICIHKNPQCTSLNRAFSCDVIANRLEGKNNTFSLPWEVRSIFMQNCFIVSALQHGRRENLWACPQCHPTTIADTLQEFELLSHQTCCSNVKPLIHKSNFSFIKSKVALLWVLASARDFALLY